MLNAHSGHRNVAFRHWPFVQRAWRQALRWYRNNGTRGRYQAAAEHVLYRYQRVRFGDKGHVVHQHQGLPPSQDLPNVAHPKSSAQIDRLSDSDPYLRYVR